MLYVLLLGQPTSLLAQFGQMPVWNTCGNKISNGDYLGSKNAVDLDFKVNQTLLLKITTAGEVIVQDKLIVNNSIKANYLAGSGFTLLQADNDGNLQSLPFPADSNQVLFGNGIWHNLPPDDGWKVNGNDMYAIPTGNIGIGTETPQKKLEVNGTLRANSVETDNLYVSYANSDSLHVANRLKIGNGTLYLSSGTDTSGGIQNSIYTDDDPLQIQCNSNFNENTIINSGNTGYVGIGTNNPQKKLHVKSFIDISINAVPGLKGSIRIEDEYYDGSISKTSTWDIEPRISMKHFLYGIDPNGPVKLNIGTPGSPVLTLVDGGYVGIGTNPNTDFALDVNGRICIRGSDFVLGTNDGRDSKTKKGNRALVHDGWQTGQDNLVINYDGDFEDGVLVGGPKTVFDGKVGIGTTNPTNKLEVNGTIRSKEIILENVNWSDFVFSSKYINNQLLSLKELNEYIEDHHHLPGIPSAKEVEKDGVYIKKMNVLLLQKVEELTLYIIEQDKRIQKLEDEMKNSTNN